MKNSAKQRDGRLLAVWAVLAAALVFIACDNPASGDSGGGGSTGGGSIGSTSSGASTGSGQYTAEAYYGTWYGSYGNIDCEVEISASGWTLSMSNGFSDYGTYTITGSNSGTGKSAVYNRVIGTATVTSANTITAKSVAVPASAAGPGYAAATVVLTRQ